MLHAACLAGLNPVALHVDHGIHLESHRWANELETTAIALGAPFASQRLEGLHAGMPNLENAARNARSHALRELAQAHKAGCILLAHHANDQAETVLLNLLRGTGLGGVGMPQQRRNDGLIWLRPWLQVPRSDILAYATAHALQWAEDPSNADLALRRNAVRHQLWPVVQAVESRALPSLLRFSSIALEAAQTEQALAAHWVQGFFQKNGENPAMEVHHLDWHGMVKDQSIPLQTALLRAWLAMLGCKPPTQAHAFAMLGQLNAKTGGGLRCVHEGWAFGFVGEFLQAAPPNRP